MDKWIIDSGIIMFEVYQEDEHGENRRKAERVVSVELPKIELDKKQNLQSISPVRVFFGNAEDMLKMVRAEETHLRIMAAAQVFDAIGRKREVEAWLHLLTIDRNKITFSSGLVESKKTARAWCQFPVTAYEMLKDDENIFCASAENMTVRFG